MDKIEYAIYYATKAHKGQRRKMEDVDMIFHPFTVGMILQRNGQD
jgi:(p)ppGpp synthase/HD superfamily hydrolase